MIRFSLGVLFIAIGSLLLAQPATDKLCVNPEFEAEVRNWIDFSVPIMSTKELANTAGEFVLLDAREIEEYNTSHIPGARHIGYNKFKKKSMAGIDKDAKVVVYCSIGYRSEKIGEKLQALGFTQVYNLYGSIFEWANQGLPLEDGQGRDTKQLHTFNKAWSKWVDESQVEKKW